MVVVVVVGAVVVVVVVVGAVVVAKVDTGIVSDVATSPVPPKPGAHPKPRFFGLSG